MSSTTYNESYRWPAGVLAVAVHGMFFLLLYLGFSWQTVPPRAMSVELWQSLPDTVDEPVATPATAVAEPVRPEPPREVVKADIALPKAKPEKKPVKIKQPKPPAKPAAAKPAAAKPDKKSAAKRAAEALEARNLDQQAAREQAEFERAEREQAAATGREVDEYKARIMTKIRNGLVEPPDVNKDARAEFLVTLLPGGRVLKVEMKRSSGNAAYDNAVERSILKSTPLPLPPDAELFERFRELNLVFRPKK